MKQQFLFTLLCFGALLAQAQTVFLKENFDYKADSTLQKNGWYGHSAATTNPIKVTSGGLIWSKTPYIGSGIGNAAAVSNTGSDENKPFSSFPDTGRVYASFLVKVDTMVTGYFFHLGEYSSPSSPTYTALSTSHRARTSINAGTTASQFKLGLTFNTATATVFSKDLNIGETYLVVIKYKFVAGAANDSASLYVFADGDDISVEPQTPAIGPLAGTQADLSFVQAVALRQYSAAQRVIVDGIIAQSSWDLVAAKKKNNVSFKVDMKNYTGASYAAVYINGNYNAWCGSCNALADADKDGVWEGTFEIGDDSIEYKFTLDGWNGQEALTAGTSCTKTMGGYTNRFVKLSGDVTLDKVCWNSCSSCVTVTKKSVTFNVDMKQYAKAFTDVYVSGTFNTWSADANKLSDVDGDDIYTLTLDLTDDSIEYKFQVDKWADDEKLTAGSTCTKTAGGFTNRFAKLSGTMAFGNVCWASCDVCATSGVGIFGASNFTVYPNPSAGMIHLTMDLVGSERVVCRVYDLKGKVLIDRSVIGQKINESFNMSAFAAGSYIMSVTSSSGTVCKQFVSFR